MDNTIKLRTGFIIILLLLGIYMVFKMLPNIPFFYHVKMTVIKQRGKIERLTDPQNVDFKAYFTVPTINFPAGSELIHPAIGPFGYQADFFLDITAGMRVKKPGDYRFSVASDDGFRLWIDGRQIGEFTENRPFTTNQYTLYLDSGEHQYRIYYYQGYGQLGLIAFYENTMHKGTFLIGRNSGDIVFH